MMFVCTNPSSVSTNEHTNSAWKHAVCKYPAVGSLITIAYVQTVTLRTHIRTCRISWRSISVNFLLLQPLSSSVTSSLFLLFILFFFLFSSYWSVFCSWCVHINWLEAIKNQKRSTPTHVRYRASTMCERGKDSYMHQPKVGSFSFESLRSINAKQTYCTSFEKESTNCENRT